MDKIFDYA